MKYHSLVLALAAAIAMGELSGAEQTKLKEAGSAGTVGAPVDPNST